MGYAVRTQLPVIQVPVESDWGYPAVADFAAAESWLDAPLGSDGTPHALILRYLAAFGPASQKDAEIWSGLRGLKGAFAALAPKLARFEDERGRTLYDLPKAPRPDEDRDAPVRFLPEYDNLVLGHDDRSRLIDDAHRKAIVTPNLRVLATFLVDGRVAGTWTWTRKKATATLEIKPFGKLPKSARAPLEEEADALLAFVEPDAEKREVRHA
jgi:hypothetical protein